MNGIFYVNVPAKKIKPVLLFLQGANARWVNLEDHPFLEFINSTGFQQLQQDLKRDHYSKALH